jgi:hypothetical protein
LSLYVGGYCARSLFKSTIFAYSVSSTVLFLVLIALGFIAAVFL